MANLTAKFQLIDEMSQKLEGIAVTGEAMLDNWESAGDAASAALDGISSSASSVESSLDGATSILEKYNAAADDAAQKTDYWTNAVGGMCSILRAVMVWS